MQKNTLVRRKDIQNALAPKVFEALSTLPLLDLTREEDQRRFFRALVHIGTETLLDYHVAPQSLMSLAAEAISKEVEVKDNALVLAGISSENFFLPVASA